MEADLLTQSPLTVDDVVTSKFRLNTIEIPYDLDSVSLHRVPSSRSDELTSQLTNRP